jgi:hypothetical protein
MSVFHSLGDFAAHLLTMEADIEAAKDVAVVKACKTVFEDCKGFDWPSEPFLTRVKARNNRAKGAWQYAFA